MLLRVTGIALSMVGALAVVLVPRPWPPALTVAFLVVVALVQLAMLLAEKQAALRTAYDGILKYNGDDGELGRSVHAGGRDGRPAIAGALSGVVSEQIWAALIAVAGTLAWISLAAFAFGMSTSWLRQDRLKVQLVANALDKKSRGT